MRIIILLFLFPAAAGISGCREGDWKKIDLLKLKEADGKEYVLGDVARGKIIIGAAVCSWDPASRKQLQILNNIGGKYKQKEVQVIVFVLNGNEDGVLETLREESECDFPFFRGDDKLLKILGNEELVPDIFIISKERILKKRIHGFIEETNLDRILLESMKTNK